ncbi:unnamed protein product [Cylicocyclus nassatus]|uniref:Uncharacterized protein n=1 Tax=Cylicocyclus nassatus TaxID=53992 RepID=A0AA36GU59_CYLNA|nr:unnamed protein product [Cylicocyclus nassatus]
MSENRSVKGNAGGKRYTFRADMIEWQAVELERSRPTSVATTERAPSERVNEIIIDSSDEDESEEGRDFPMTSKASAPPADTHPMPPPAVTRPHPKEGQEATSGEPAKKKRKRSSAAMNV